MKKKDAKNKNESDAERKRLNAKFSKKEENRTEKNFRTNVCLLIDTSLRTLNPSPQEASTEILFNLLCHSLITRCHESLEGQETWEGRIFLKDQEFQCLILKGAYFSKKEE